jgi:hypothetical protein
MVHQQSKIFYKSGAGKLKSRISYSAGEPFVPEGIISVPSLTSF